MALAAANNHLHIVKWLHENRSEGCTIRAMGKAVKKDHLQVNQWLHVNRAEVCTVRPTRWTKRRSMVISESCRWLHENRNERCTTEAMDAAKSIKAVEWFHAKRIGGKIQWNYCGSLYAPDPNKPVLPVYPQVLRSYYPSFHHHLIKKQAAWTQHCHPPQTSPPLSRLTHDEGAQIHLYCPRLPLTAVSAVCSARGLLDPLVSTISNFITRTGWTVVSACRKGDLQLLQRVIAIEAPISTHPLYRSDTFSQALRSTVEHGNAIKLLECLRAYCPTDFAGEGMAEAASFGKIDVLEWLVANRANVTWNPNLLVGAAEGGHLNVLQWLTAKFPENDLDWEGAREITSSRGHVGIVMWIHGNTTGAPTAAHKYRLGEKDYDARTYLFEHGYKHLGLSEPIDMDVLSYWGRPL